MCDTLANDVIKALLAIPFALDGLADKELNTYNSQKAGGSRRVKDSCKPMISAVCWHCCDTYCFAAYDVRSIDELSGLTTG